MCSGNRVIDSLNLHLYRDYILRAKFFKSWTKLFENGSVKFKPSACPFRPNRL